LVSFFDKSQFGRVAVDVFWGLIKSVGMGRKKRRIYADFLVKETKKT
jgi:hypothetical protein